MTLYEAWKILGINLEEVASRIISRPRIDRGKAAEVEFDIAKKYARNLMAKYHPDRNLDNIEAQTKFKDVQNALEVINKATEEFVQELQSVLEEEAQHKLKRQKNAVFIKLG
jgi:hypothetical protein